MMSPLASKLLVLKPNRNSGPELENKKSQDFAISKLDTSECMTTRVEKSNLSYLSKFLNN